MIPAQPNRFALSTGLVGGLLSLPIFPHAATAQEREAERGSLTFAAFLTNRATEARVDSANGNGTDLDLEDDLGLARSTTVARLSGFYWLTARQRFDFSVFDLSRAATTQITKTIAFGDTTFAVNTAVTASSDLTIGKFDYTFAALSRQRGYLGVVAGLYVTTGNLSLHEVTLDAGESHDLTAPLPVLGLRGEYQVGKHITLRGDVEWFSLHTGGIGGNLRDSYVGVDYGFGKRMAVGLAYNNTSMKISEESGGFQSRVDWGYDGPLLYFKLDFGSRVPAQGPAPRTSPE
jgi:hypothetical protein